jgi:hypothetical protein
MSPSMSSVPWCWPAALPPTAAACMLAAQLLPWQPAACPSWPMLLEVATWCVLDLVLTSSWVSRQDGLHVLGAAASCIACRGCAAWCTWPCTPGQALLLAPAAAAADVGGGCNGCASCEPPGGTRCCCCCCSAHGDPGARTPCTPCSSNTLAATAWLGVTTPSPVCRGNDAPTSAAAACVLLWVAPTEVEGWPAQHTHLLSASTINSMVGGLTLTETARCSNFSKLPAGTWKLH